MDRTTRGRLTMTVVDAETQKVVPGGRHDTWKGETADQSRVQIAALGEGLVAIAKTPLFGPDFNEGSDGKTYEVHVNSHSFYEDTNEPEQNFSWEKFDVDSVEVKAIHDFLETQAKK
jgi:hypothetical protein